MKAFIENVFFFGIILSGLVLVYLISNQYVLYLK